MVVIGILFGGMHPIGDIESYSTNSISQKTQPLMMMYNYFENISRLMRYIQVSNFQTCLKN